MEQFSCRLYEYDFGFDLLLPGLLPETTTDMQIDSLGNSDSFNDVESSLNGADANEACGCARDCNCGLLGGGACDLDRGSAGIGPGAF